jgi:hypothetical protein
MCPEQVLTHTQPRSDQGQRPVGVRVGRGSSPAYKLVHARLAPMATMTRYRRRVISADEGGTAKKTPPERGQKAANREDRQHAKTRHRGRRQAGSRRQGRARPSRGRHSTLERPARSRPRHALVAHDPGGTAQVEAARRRLREAAAKAAQASRQRACFRPNGALGGKGAVAVAGLTKGLDRSGSVARNPNFVSRRPRR